MSAPAAAIADAFQLLQMDLYHHLDEAEFLAVKCEGWTEDDADTARKLIPDLTTVIRGLLFDHQVRPGELCQVCASSWPCPVISAIHGVLKDPDRQYVALVEQAFEDDHEARVCVVLGSRSGGCR